MSETQTLLGFTLGKAEFECTGFLQGIDMLMRESVKDKLESCRLLLSCSSHNDPKYVYIEDHLVYAQFSHLLNEHGLDIRSLELKVSGTVEYANGQRGVLDAKPIVKDIRVKK